jgi:hypothetical protein
VEFHTSATPGQWRRLSPRDSAVVCSLVQLLVRSTAAALAVPWEAVVADGPSRNDQHR